MTQLTLDLPHRAALGLEDFLVTQSNTSAVGWIDRWPDWPGHALALVGGEASGKSHLARVWQLNTRATPVDAAGISTYLAGLGCALPKSLLVEDVDHGIDEEGLFHLFNWCRAESGHLLLTARVPPARWQVTLPDLASRLKTVPVAAIDEPDDMLLMAIMSKQFTDRQIAVDSAVLEYLVPRMERSFAAAQHLVAALDQASLAEKRRITVPLAKKILKELS